LRSRSRRVFDWQYFILFRPKSTQAAPFELTVKHRTLHSKLDRRTRLLGWHSCLHTGHSPCTHDQRYSHASTGRPCPCTTMPRTASRRYARTAWRLATSSGSGTVHSALSLEHQPPLHTDRHHRLRAARGWRSCCGS
jgi:hypothetical protein